MKPSNEDIQSMACNLREDTGMGFCRQAADMLEALLAERSEREGWKLVPVEADETMLDAGKNAHYQA